MGGNKNINEFISPNYIVLGYEWINKYIVFPPILDEMENQILYMFPKQYFKLYHDYNTDIKYNTYFNSPPIVKIIK